MTQVTNDSTAQLVTIACDAVTAQVSCYGAELQRLTTAGGDDLQWDGDSTVWHGRAPILLPVIGLLEGGKYRLDGKVYTMPKHGFARRSTFDVIATTASSVEFRLSASEATRSTRSSFSSTSTSNSAGPH